MVQMNENNPEYQPTVKPEKESLLKKYDIPLDHLDFKYLETCNNAKEIEQIFQILRSGEEGYYPDLLKYTEERLFEVKPNSKLLKYAVRILSKYDIPKDEWDELSSDLQNWIEDANKNDQELVTFQDIKPNTNNVPVRDFQKQNNNKNDQKKERIKSMDYDAWDKLDVDTEILKMDIKDEKIKEEALEKVKEKEKLNTVVLDPDLMTKAELRHAALQAKNAGNESYKLGEYEDALQYYTNSLIFLPSAAAYNNRAVTNIKLKNYKEAIKDCNEVLKLENKNEKAFLRKCTALKLLKQYDKGIEIIETYLQINPNSIDAQNLMQDLKKLSGKNEKVKSVRLKIEDHSGNKDEEKCTKTNEEINTNTTKKENLKNTTEEIKNKNHNTNESAEKYDESYTRRSTSNKSIELKEAIKQNGCKIKSSIEINANDRNTENGCKFKSTMNEISTASIKQTKNVQSSCAQNKKETDNEFRDNVLIPIPSTSKFAGPFYRVVNVPRDLAKKITNTKKTFSKSDENVINLNQIKHTIRKRPIQNITTNEIARSDNKENENKIQNENTKSPTITEIKKISPFEFLRYWQAIKSDPTLEEHENLLRSLNPSNLADVVGNKLDGEMFSLLLQCLVSRFTKEQDFIFIQKILIDLQKIPRINIIMLLMDDNDKINIQTLISRIKSKEFQENVSEKIKRFFNYY